jgi:hypothetical protein
MMTMEGMGEETKTLRKEGSVTDHVQRAADHALPQFLGRKMWRVIFAHARVPALCQPPVAPVVKDAHWQSEEGPEWPAATHSGASKSTRPARGYNRNAVVIVILQQERMYEIMITNLQPTV